MNFIKYPSLENHYQSKYLLKVESSDAVNGEWVATEKLHGANFSLWSNGMGVKAARRTGFLEEGESFYGCWPVVEKYKDAALELSRLIISPVVLFGELVGPGIQSGVHYSDEKDFIVFDVAYVLDEKLVFLDFTDKIINILKGIGFNVVPVLKRGTYQEVMELDNLYNSTYGDFIAEGYVAKPVVSYVLPNGSRVGIKSKNEHFSEKKSSNKPKIQISDSVRQHSELASDYVTQNRFNNVLSKLGEFDQKLFGKYIGLLVADALDDYIKENEIELESNDLKQIKKLLQNKAREIIKQNF